MESKIGLDDFLLNHAGEAFKELPASPPPPDYKSEVARLAALNLLEYESVRKDEAKRLKIDRVSVLDKVVSAARGQKEAEDKSMFPSNEPWHEPVDGRLLVNQLAEAFNSFSVLPKGSAITAALWSILTYIFDVWGTLPLLAVLSPEKRCGKTTFLTTLAGLCNRVLPVSNISPAAVYRSIEAFKPTLLIDEGDTFLRDNDELRGVINSGHTKSTAFVIRCEGDNHEPVKFTTWCPKAIAMIGAPPDTIRDRSIVVNLRRKLPEERTEAHGEEHSETFGRLRSMIVRWVEDHDAELRIVKPDRLDTTNDRQADNWRPLLTIAKVASCEAEARDAAMLSTGDEREELPAKIQLLCDIREIFHESGVDRLSSAVIVKSLVALEDRPWSEWKHGKPLTSATMSRLLKPFGVHSTTIRFPDGLAKGYVVDSFVDAFTRYIPPVQNVTTLQANNINKLNQFQNVTSAPDVTLLNHANYPETRQCYDVTLSTGLEEKQHASELEDFDIEAEVIGHAG
jgi:putative DNA primase/helicase